MPASPPASSATEPASETWTVGRLLDWTRQRFTAEGIESPRVDAEHLLAFALGCDRMSLYVEHDKVINGPERARFRDLVRRRLTREPVAYIEGKRGFHALDLELHVDARVLVPRPETELLVDWMLEELPADADGAVLDVGTGSGAIALALKRARPGLQVVACDLSEDAVAVARANAERLGLEVTVHRSDLLGAVPDPGAGWSAIAANLPYVCSSVWPTLAPEVQRFEPRLALDGGEDGLDVIRRLLETAPARLAPGAGLYLEIGYDQGESVPELLSAAGLVDVALRQDLSGHPRLVRGRRSG